MPRSHGPTRPPASIVRCAKSGPKTTGPQIAPETAPKSTNDIPRARRSGGNISAAAARASSTTDAAPRRRARGRGRRGTPTSAAQPPRRCRSRSPPSTKPPRITGIRPVRSINRPAGPTAIAPAARKIAGPSPRMPLTPVTATSVSELSAAASWKRPSCRRASRRAGRRSAGRPLSQRECTPQARGERDRAAVRGVANVRRRRAPRPRAVRLRRRAGRASARRGTAARPRTSARVGRRFDVAVPGCVGTTFQSSTSSATPSSASTRCTIVALASAGPAPVSCRSDVNGDAADACAAVAGCLADENHLCVARARRGSRAAGRAAAPSARTG